MKLIKDLYGFVFGKAKPNKKRKLTPPSERPKNAYLKYVEYGLINEGALTGHYTGNWIQDQKEWRYYFKHNKDFVMISIKNYEAKLLASPLKEAYLQGLEKHASTEKYNTNILINDKV